jgi:hypothetical protein
METAEKICVSIGAALIITALFTLLYYYIYKQQMKELCISMGGNYTETSNFWYEETSCNITKSSMTIITSTTITQNITTINSQNLPDFCPENMTSMEIVCDCAKLDSEYYKMHHAICLAKCFECVEEDNE